MDVRQYGICIGTRVWKENDRMLKVFMEDGAVYDVLARGACKPKYKLKFATQLFSTGIYELCPSKAGYYILGGASFGELSFLSIAGDPDAYMAGCVVCEIASKCTLSENKRMYAETLAALGELSRGAGVRCDNVVLRMLIAAFVSGGYGAEFPSGERRATAETILGGEVGNLSDLDTDRSAVSSLIKYYAARFSSRFGTLGSITLGAF